MQGLPGSDDEDENEDMEPSPNLLSPSSSSPEKEVRNDNAEQLQLEPNEVRTTFPVCMYACMYVWVWVCMHVCLRGHATRVALALQRHGLDIEEAVDEFCGHHREVRDDGGARNSTHTRRHACTDTRAPAPVCVQIFSESESDQNSGGGNSSSGDGGSEGEREVSGRLGCRARPVMVQVPARSVRAPGCW